MDHRPYFHLILFIGFGLALFYSSFSEWSPLLIYMKTEIGKDIALSITWLMGGISICFGIFLAALIRPPK